MNFSKLELDVSEIVNKNIDNIFDELVKYYELKFGDMSPEDVDRVDFCKEELIKLCMNYVKNNK